MISWDHARPAGASMSAADGLRIVFDPAIDGGAWPGPLRDRVAVVGEAWLGSLGLLDRLELELGLLARHATATERVADLARKLERRDGFWRRSFEVDPIGTSRRLLADRGTLALWGWQGERASVRLVALWDATREALPGVADRLRRVAELLPRRRPDIASIRIVEPIATLEPLWRRLFKALAAVGVQIEEAPLVASEARGDLAAARASAFEPIGDGTLQLVRPHGPLAAAEEVAAALASLPGLHDVVLIGGDAMLDDALVRHGLPRTGAEVAAPASSGLVRLIVEAAFTPMDPADLHALLCIDPGPIPRVIAGRLVRALHELPSRHAPPWRDAIADGLATIDDGRDALAARLRALLDPVVDRGGAITMAQLTARMRALTTWARGRLREVTSLSEVITFAEGLLSLAAIMGVEQIDRARARRMCDEVDRNHIAGPPAQAGLARVPRPGAMLGPARVAVWWGFTRELAPAPPRLRLSEAERAALRAAGVTPPDAGADMAAEARRWRRPLLLASEALVLVCPRTSEASDTAHPHPLWDELRASMRDPSLADRLHSPSPRRPLVATCVQAALRPAPIGFASARAPTAIAVRATESPSSVERLLGCSLAWALHYPGRLQRGLSAGPPEPSPLLFGSLAHQLLAQVFAGGALTPTEATARATEILDTILPTLAESLSLPEHQVERATVRRVVLDSARGVAAILTDTGASIRGVEVELSRAFANLTIAGRADLLLANPDLVIDYKWGDSGPRRLMKAGAAIQLAAYAELGRASDATPGVAYLILNKQHILAPPGTELPGATPIGRHRADEMWRATMVSLDARMQQLASGDLAAPGALADSDESALTGHAMHVAAPCGYCQLTTICGRRRGT